MTHLIPLPDRHGPAGSARLWFNPDHIVTVAPRVIQTDAGHTLSVELKLTGIPVMDAWLGDHPSAETADTAWRDFLTSLDANARAAD